MEDVMVTQDYSLADTRLLREELIELRNTALQQSDFEWSVKLSHVVALLAGIIEQKEQTL